MPAALSTISSHLTLPTSLSYHPGTGPSVFHLDEVETIRTVSDDGNSLPKTESSIIVVIDKTPMADEESCFTTYELSIAHSSRSMNPTAGDIHSTVDTTEQTSSRQTTVPMESDLTSAHRSETIQQSGPSPIQAKGQCDEKASGGAQDSTSMSTTQEGQSLGVLALTNVNLEIVKLAEEVQKLRDTIDRLELKGGTEVEPGRSCDELLAMCKESPEDRDSKKLRASMQAVLLALSAWAMFTHGPLVVEVVRGLPMLVAMYHAQRS